MNGCRLTLHGAAAQEALGARLARDCPPGLRIYLAGDLGTGKTTLVRGFLRALGHGGAVRSPTYTLLEPYELPAMRVHHLDLYRLGDPDELEFLGLREALDGSVTLLIEWPDRGEGWLPPADVSIAIRHAGAARELDLRAHTSQGMRALTGACPAES